MLIGSTETNIHCNLLFLLADVMETAMMDVNELLKKDGNVLRHEARRNFNTAISSIRKLRHSAIDKCRTDTQQDFANDSDMTYEFLKLLIDRCGEDDEKLFKFYNYIKQFPSQCNMKQLDSSVFNAISK